MGYYLKLAAALLLCLYAVFTVPADAIQITSRGLVVSNYDRVAEIGK